MVQILLLRAALRVQPDGGDGVGEGEALSYRVLERPFLELKARLAKVPSRPV